MESHGLDALPTFPAERTNPLNPPDLYAFIRSHKPVSKVRLWDGATAWLVTRYSDVKAILSNPTVSVVPSNMGFPTFSPARAAQLEARRSFVNMDPPDHTFYRKLLSGEFAPKRLAGMRPMIQSIADELLDDMIAVGPPADLRAAYAMPLPATIISKMLGVPDAYRDQLRMWTETRNSISAAANDVRGAARDMLALLSQLILDKIRRPQDDLLSRLAKEQIIPGHLSVEDASHIAALLYAAGYDTSANQIALGALNLLADRRQWNRVCENPTLLRPAIEEMLRFNTIVHLNSARVATADIEIGGETIKAGEGIYALISAANRDPSVFADPDAFDPTRPINNHLAFSFGVHQCLGQMLARIELDIAFGTLIRRLPDLRLGASVEQLRFDADYHVFHVKELPVRW